MKIILCCKAGVTSNMFATKLKEEAAKRNLEILIWATAEVSAGYSIDQADCVLVTPQLRSSLSKLEDLAPSSTPVVLIDENDFKEFNASHVLTTALNAVNQTH